MRNGVFMASRAAGPDGRNEDSAIVGDGFAVLSDGATGLSDSPALFPEAGSDAGWFARGLCLGVAAALVLGQQPAEAALTASAGLRRRWESAGGSFDNPLGHPSATLDIVAWGRGTVHVWSVGDSPVCLLYGDGHVEWVGADPVLARLTQRNARAVAAALKSTGGDFEEARAIAHPAIAASRSKKNVPGGYWIADMGCAWQRHMRHAEFPSDGLRCLAAMSDGFACCLEYGVVRDEKDLMTQISDGQAENIIDRIRDVEHADSRCVRFPRPKTSDDATVAAVMWKCIA